MASYLRPRRGTYAKATSTLTGSASLKAGEVFFEYQSGGLGTKPGKIKLGKDGSTTYSSLAYFVDGVNCGNQYPNGWACTSSTTAAFSTTYGNILSSNPMSQCMSAIKQLLINLSANVTSLNNEMNNTYITGPTGINNYSIITGAAFRRSNMYFARIQGKMSAAISSGAMDTPLVQLPMNVLGVVGGVSVYVNNAYNFVPLIQLASGSPVNKVCQGYTSVLQKDQAIMFLIIAKI